MREKVTRALEAAVIAGELTPGTIYSAPALAESFGVSATPVREAMLDLVGEGFVEPVRNRGFRVLEVSDADLDEISEVRLLLEIPAVSRVIGKLTSDRIAHLQTLAQAIEDAAAAGDLLRYLDSDRRFHVDLVSSLGNSRLTELVDRLRRQARLFGLRELASQGDLLTSAREHTSLLKLICDGDAAAAEDLMRAHIVHTRGLWAGHQSRSS